MKSTVKRLLGQQTELPTAPELAELQGVSNPYRDSYFTARFTCPEFTSLCPVTRQPDFANIVIDYLPAAELLESKSLKLFLASFRNHGAYHEECTLMIGHRIVAAISPTWIRVCSYWYPRGGIPIDVFWTWGFIPDGVWVPEPLILSYQGRHVAPG